MIASQLRRPERRSMVQMYALLGGGTIIILAAMGFLFRCRLGVPCEQPINLTAHVALVKLLSTNGDGAIVPLETNQSVSAGDKIDVDARGEALLHFPDFLDVRIFRDSQLTLSADSSVSTSAPAAYRLRLESGTIFNTVNSEKAGDKRVLVTTQWAEIQHIGTTFLVNYDPQTQRTWVVTVQGAVELRSTGANGATNLVTVPAGWQSWVDPRQPPAPPVPATRPAIGRLFPPVDQLTNGAIPDGAVLAQAAATATATLAATATPTPTATLTATPTPTVTPTATNVPPPAPADVPTDTPTGTPTDTPTGTPTDTPTATSTITPSAGVDNIRNLRVKIISGDTAEVTVDYTYASDHGDNVRIEAYVPSNTDWFANGPVDPQVVRGDGTATTLLGFGAGANNPPQATSSQIIVFLWDANASYAQAGAFYSQTFDYTIDWSLAPTPTNTPAAVSLDLVAMPNSINVPKPACTGGISGTINDPSAQCTYQVNFQVGAGSFNTNATVSYTVLVEIPQANLSQTVTVDANVTAKQADVRNLSVDLGSGPNCYATSCSIRITVDPQDVVPETDESNNVIERDVSWLIWTK